MTRVGVVGAAGKMGKTLVAMIRESPDLDLAAAVDQPGQQAIGQDAGTVANVGETGVFIADDLAQVVADIDVLIDFTIAVATEKSMEICHSAGTRMVIGTTGLSESQIVRLDEISSSVPVVFASNYSIGVNATFQLVEMAVFRLHQLCSASTAAHNVTPLCGIPHLTLPLLNWTH